MWVGWARRKQEFYFAIFRVIYLLHQDQIFDHIVWYFHDS